MRARLLAAAAFALTLANSSSGAEEGVSPSACALAVPRDVVLPTDTKVTRIEFETYQSVSLSAALASGPLSAPTIRLDAMVLQPRGQGPFPAVIINHGSGNLHRYHFEYARNLVREGFVVAIFDGFCRRGFKSVPGLSAGGQQNLSAPTSIADNYFLLDALAKRPFVDAEKYRHDGHLSRRQHWAARRRRQDARALRTKCRCLQGSCGGVSRMYQPFPGENGIENQAACSACQE